MDGLGGGLANVDVTRLSDADKQQLQQFAINEGQKARIQSCMSLNHFRIFSSSTISAFGLALFISALNGSHDQSLTDFHSHSLPYRHMFPQMHPRRRY
jgi:myo-inositol-hexaphosphate 3-phosphohydrolase